MLFAKLFLDAPESWKWLLAGALVVTAGGVADDIWELGAGAKLGFQILAGGIVILGGCQIAAVTHPISGASVELGWLSVPITLLWVVGITNAFNLIDGLDGLAAGVALIATSTLFLVSVGGERVDVAILTAALAGALVGFLYYNFNPASIFLGDSGSLLLGFSLSVLSIESSQKGATAVVILVPVLALGLPIMDTLLAILRRSLRPLRVRRSGHVGTEYSFHADGPATIFGADREHIHHRLVAMGWTHRGAVLLLYGVALALGVLAFLSVSMKGWDTAVVVAVVAGATYLGIRKLGYQEVAVLQRGTLLPLFDLPVVNRKLFHALLDAGFIAAAYVLAFYVAHEGRVGETARAYLLHTVVVAVAVKVATFFQLGVYERKYRYTRARDMIRLVRGVLVSGVLVATVLWLTYGLPSRAFPVFVLDLYLTATLTIGVRVSFKVLELLAEIPGRAADRRVLIYGAGTAGRVLLAEMDHQKQLGEPVGFVDDQVELQGAMVEGLPVLGQLQDLDRLIRKHRIQEVVLAAREVPDERVQTAAAISADCGVAFRRFRTALEQVGSSAWTIQGSPAQKGHEPSGSDIPELAGGAAARLASGEPRRQ